MNIKPIFQLFKCNSDVGKREKMIKTKKSDKTVLKTGKNTYNCEKD